MAEWLTRLVARVPAPLHAKLLAAFLAIVVLLVAVGAAGLQALTGANRRADELVTLQRKIAAYRQLHHDTTAQLYSVTAALLVPEEEREAEQGQIDRDEVDDAGSVTAYEGAAELLAGPIPIAVVTSGSTELATARLRGAGLEPPAVLITANSIERGKPDPEPFLLGAQELGVAPARCLALEDAPSGIE